jgi:hypothetical protein
VPPSFRVWSFGPSRNDGELFWRIAADAVKVLPEGGKPTP